MTLRNFNRLLRHLISWQKILLFLNKLMLPSSRRMRQSSNQHLIRLTLLNIVTWFASFFAGSTLEDSV